MSWRGSEEPQERDLIRFAITGKNAELWERLQGRIFEVVDAIVTRIADTADLDAPETDAVVEVAQDLAKLATDWARAKLERPSLENQKLQAEIAVQFAEAKKTLAEARKLDAETRQIDANTQNQVLDGLLTKLEKLMRMMGSITISRVGGDTHILAGPTPAELGDPQGTATAPTEEVGE